MTTPASSAQATQGQRVITGTPLVPFRSPNVGVSIPMGDKTKKVQLKGTRLALSQASNGPGRVSFYYVNAEGKRIDLTTSVLHCLGEELEKLPADAIVTEIKLHHNPQSKSRLQSRAAEETAPVLYPHCDVEILTGRPGVLSAVSKAFFGSFSITGKALKNGVTYGIEPNLELVPTSKPATPPPLSAKPGAPADGTGGQVGGAPSETAARSNTPGPQDSAGGTEGEEGAAGSATSSRSNSPKPQAPADGTEGEEGGAGSGTSSRTSSPKPAAPADGIEGEEGAAGSATAGRSNSPKPDASTVETDGQEGAAGSATSSRSSSPKPQAPADGTEGEEGAAASATAGRSGSPESTLRTYTTTHFELTVTATEEQCKELQRLEKEYVTATEDPNRESNERELRALQAYRDELQNKQLERNRTNLSSSETPPALSSVELEVATREGGEQVVQDSSTVPAEETDSEDNM